MNRFLSSFLTALSATCISLTVWGCEDGKPDSDPKVPFKLGQPVAPQASGTEPGTQATAPEPEAASYTPPLDKPSLDGALLGLDSVRAVLLVDVDGDGDRDALVLLDDAAKKVRLVLCTREPHGFGDARDVSGFDAALEPNQNAESARIEALSAGKAWLTLLTSYAEPPGPGPQVHFAFSLEAAPRVFERVELAPARPETRALTLSAKSADGDADGHDDVQLALALAPAAPAPTAAPEALTLTLFDRPSGLVRDAREPETTLAAWASAALGLVKTSPEQAVARAQDVLAMRRALCREAGEPLLRMGHTLGIACGPGKSSVEASLAMVLAEAKKAHVGEAFNAYRSLLRSDPKPDTKTLDRAHAALRTLPAESGVTLREGPAIDRAGNTAVSLPHARFVDENTLFVRRAAAVFVNLESGAETPASNVGDDWVRDPSGQLAVTAIERGCNGYSLRIERRAPFQELAAPTVSMPLLLALAGPAGCTQLPESERRDTGGFRVLGWAPQGVVASRGAELFLVPLNVEGKPSGDARAVPHDVPAPAPLPLGSALVDGSQYVEATPFGVLVHTPHGPSLLRPDGYDTTVRAPNEAALSPSGARVAVVSEGRVFFLTRTQTARTAAASSP